MTDKQLVLAIDTIRALTDALGKPVTELNHIDKLELCEAAEVVLVGLGRRE